MGTNSGPDWTAFGGDRNFVRDLSERQSSAATQSQPSSRMIAAWSTWLTGIGRAHEVHQPDLTWSRFTREGRSPSWVYEVFDVVGTNENGAVNSQVAARRVDSVPYPRVSDHWPVGLRWLPIRHRRKQRRANQETSSRVRRPIPRWLPGDGGFLAALDGWFNEWLGARPRGLDGLQSFTDVVYEYASRYLKTT